MDDTFSRLQGLLVQQLGITPEQVTPATLLVPHHDDMGRQLESQRPHLGCDSLDVVELVMAVEEEWLIEVPDDEAEPLNTGTVQDCCDLIDRKLAAA
jgi:acyl carrier protein